MLSNFPTVKGKPTKEKERRSFTASRSVITSLNAPGHNPGAITVSSLAGNTKDE